VANLRRKTMFRKNQSPLQILGAITARPAKPILIALLGLIAFGALQTASNAAQTVHRPLSDFLSAQGSVSVFNCCAPMVPDYIGWTRPFSTPAADQRLALVDYAGVGNNWLVANGYPSLGTTISGNITERPLADGRAEVTVNLHTRNALAYVLPYDVAGPINQNQINPLLFGFKPQDLLADSDKQPALGQSHLQVVFKNPAPGASLPDIVNAFVLGNTVPGQELVSFYFNATATGGLRAASGFPEGATGRLKVVQTGILFRGPFKGATSDGFPVEVVELHRVGQ
jgi:hypothetical protein